MSNINKQELREAAEKATGAHDRLSILPADDIFDISQHEGTQLDADITAMNAFSESANPSTVLALLDELEAAEKRIAEPVAVPDLKPVGFLFVSDDGAVAYSPAGWPMKGFNLIGPIYGDVNACRAAMLQAGNHTEQYLDMVGHSGDATEKVIMPQGADQPQNVQQNIPENIPATQFKPVADLYEMQFDDGRTCAFHTDGAKAAQWLLTCDGNKVQEYVKLERYQEALSGNSPVIPDGWVMVPVDATRAMIDAAARVEEDGYDAMHKAMIAAAPQQEADNG